MEKKKYTDEELKELDDLLQDDFNDEIYNELNHTDYSELFEPLDFFRMFHSQVAFIKENKSQPSIAIQKLNDFNLSDKQKHIVLDYLNVYFSGEASKDADIRICCRKIEYLMEELEEKLENENEKSNTVKIEAKDEFQELLKHLKTLHSYKEKIAYLIKEKTRYEQNQSGLEWNIDNEKTFPEKCDLEIKKLMELRSLEQKEVVSKESLKKHKDLTLDRAALFLNYLFKGAGANCHNTKKAEAISFLTGYSKNTVGDKLSSLHSKADENFLNYKKDMEIIRKYFESLGLSEIVEMINRDLNIEN
jgi:hypothetical protein